MDLWITKVAAFLFITNVYSQQFFNTMPPPVNTSFTCRGRDTGFYADIETNCRVYHTCDENGNKFTYYCPAETAFRQEALVCDHAHLVDCSTGRRVSKISEKPRNKAKVEEESPSFMDKNDSTHNSAKQDAKSSSSAYTRSFKITQEPQSQFSTPRNKQQPTFVLSSSVFLRDRGNFKRGETSQSRELPNVDKAKYEPTDGATSEENGEGYERLFSSTTKPSSTGGADFTVKQRTRVSLIYRSTPTYDERTKKIATTGRSDIANSGIRRIFGTSGASRNNEKFKLSYPNEGDSRAGIENEKIISSVDFNHDYRPMEDEKREITTHFRARPINDETRESEEKNEDGARVYAENTSIMFSKNIDRSKSPKDSRITSHARPTFPHDSSNFPYFETLRSMQAMAEKTFRANFTIDQSNPTLVSFSSTSAAPPTTAGTEFPVLPFAGTFSPLGPNELDDDPYYPKRSTTTEAYYKLADIHGEDKKSARFSTNRPWPGSLNFEIPEVLPDLNTLDDLVDRRKFFYIPRVNKDTSSNRELHN